MKKNILLSFIIVFTLTFIFTYDVKAEQMVCSYKTTSDTAQIDITVDKSNKEIKKRIFYPDETINVSMGLEDPSSNPVSIADFKKGDKYYCPDNIYFAIKTDNYSSQETIYVVSFKEANALYEAMPKNSSGCKNEDTEPNTSSSHGGGFGTPTQDSGDSQSDTTQEENSNSSTENNDALDNNCADFAKTLRLLGYLLLTVKMVLPFIIIITASLDAFKVVTSGNSSDATKVVKKVMYSIISAAIVFLIPNIVDAAVGLVNSEKNNDAEICRACVFEPTKAECKKYIK